MLRNKCSLLIPALVISILTTFGCHEDTESPRDDEIIETPEESEDSGVFFSDDFGTGDLSKTENGFIWSAENKVEVALTPNGTSGLKFNYGPDDLNEDSWKEQRFELGKEYSDLWIKYNLYIPEEFHHRCPVKYELHEVAQNMQPGDTVYKTSQDGMISDINLWGIVYATSGTYVWVDKLWDYYQFLDGNYMKNSRTGIVSQIKKREGYGANNKFILLWQGEYGSLSTGNSIDMECWSRERGNSCLSYYLSVDQGAKLRNDGHTISDNYIIEKCKDAGTWMELIYHFKIASDTDNDGIIQVIKNGEEYLHVRDIGNHSDMGNNYFEYGYLLGYSNSGFKEETIFYIDNVVFSTDSISSQGL